MMHEDRLQYDCVTWFNNTYKDKRGMLLEINNKTNKGAYRKGLGLVKGASDLMLIEPRNLSVLFIELKVNGSRHDVKHLKNQCDWLHKMNGGFFGTFVFSEEQFKALIQGFYLRISQKTGFYSQISKPLSYVKTVTENAKTKTVKLDYPHA